jgi:hypothetical protein
MNHAGARLKIQKIRNLLVTDENVEDALIFLYDTEGKSAFFVDDRELLSSFAEQVLDRLARGISLGKCLSAPKGDREGQIGWARRKLMSRYVPDLVKHEWEPRGDTILEDAGIEILGEQPLSQAAVERLDALRATVRTIDLCAKWLETSNEHTKMRDREATKHRYHGVQMHARNLVTEPESELLVNEEFIKLARRAKPCSRCNGSGEHPNGECFRCSGKGFQIARDEIRNELYDRRKEA